MVLVMLAALSERRRKPVSEGKVMKVPPPATALTAAAMKEAMLRNVTKCYGFAPIYQFVAYARNAWRN
jgi:hypothetical protein